MPNVSEADVANRILDIAGIDGLIIDAEGHWEGKPNAATALMHSIRAAHPNSCVADAPFAIIDLHLSYPYLEFGKYADAAMPQAYWKDIGQTPTVMANTLKQQWDQWHPNWQNGGYGDSVKPVIPIGQGLPVQGFLPSWR